MIGHKNKNLIANIFQIRYHLPNGPVKSQHKTGGGSRISRPQKDVLTVKFIFLKNNTILKKIWSLGTPPQDPPQQDIFGRPRGEHFADLITSNKMSSSFIF